MKWKWKWNVNVTQFRLGASETKRTLSKQNGHIETKRTYWDKTDSEFCLIPRGGARHCRRRWSLCHLHISNCVARHCRRRWSLCILFTSSWYTRTHTHAHTHTHTHTHTQQQKNEKCFFFLNAVSHNTNSHIAARNYALRYTQNARISSFVCCLFYSWIFHDWTICCFPLFFSFNNRKVSQQPRVKQYMMYSPASVHVFPWSKYFGTCASTRSFFSIIFSWLA